MGGSLILAHVSAALLSAKNFPTMDVCVAAALRAMAGLMRSVVGLWRTGARALTVFTPAKRGVGLATVLRPAMVIPYPREVLELLTGFAQLRDAAFELKFLDDCLLYILLEVFL
jgi:DNA-binding LytR/AlgR family response regulator